MKDYVTSVADAPRTARTDSTQSQSRGEEKMLPDLPRIPIRFMRPVGDTFKDMQRHAQQSDLYKFGDMTLVWVNEGDFYLSSLIEFQPPCVSDGSPQGQDAKRLDRNDDSTAALAETPFHTSPLNKGAVEKPIAILKMVAANSERDGLPNTAASLRQVIDLLLSLSSNLEETQKERDAWRDRESETQEALQLIGEEFGVLGGEPRVDGIRRVLTEARAKLAETQKENERLRADIDRADRMAKINIGVAGKLAEKKEAAESQLSLLQKRLEEVEGALKTTTDVLDTFGNLSDALISPEAWSIHGAEEAIAVALAALHPKGESR